MNFLMLLIIMIGYLPMIHAMDTEECDEGEQRRQKVHFIRDTFTTVHTWDHTLALKAPCFSYREATTKHTLYPTPAATFAVTVALTDYAQKKNISSSVASVALDHGGNTFIGCTDGTLYVLTMERNGSMTYKQIARCHDSAITSICPITTNWLALGGGHSITFCSMNRFESKLSVLIPRANTITHLHEEHGVLIVTKNSTDQFICYPYSANERKLFRGIHTSDTVINFLARVALAIYKNKPLCISKEEHTVYSHLPEYVTSLIQKLVKNIEITTEKNM